MERRLIAGHSPYEPIVGYSRAVVAGDRVHVSGTAPIRADGSPPPDDPYQQAKLCFEIIADALERAGSGLEHVVRSRVYLTDAALWQDVARAHGEAFADVRPANTTVVAQLLDPAWKVEIEVEALVPQGATEAL
jgi:enamine deaminase RidA (YjgF/YER057c/UK114 family)